MNTTRNLPFWTDVETRFNIPLLFKSRFIVWTSYRNSLWWVLYYNTRDASSTSPALLQETGSYPSKMILICDITKFAFSSARFSKLISDGTLFNQSIYCSNFIYVRMLRMQKLTQGSQINGSLGIWKSQFLGWQVGRGRGFRQKTLLYLYFYAFCLL